MNRNSIKTLRTYRHRQFRESQQESSCHSKQLENCDILDFLKPLHNQFHSYFLAWVIVRIKQEK